MSWEQREIWFSNYSFLISLDMTSDCFTLLLRIWYKQVNLLIISKYELYAGYICGTVRIKVNTDWPFSIPLHPPQPTPTLTMSQKSKTHIADYTHNPHPHVCSIIISSNWGPWSWANIMWAGTHRLSIILTDKEVSADGRWVRKNWETCLESST